MRDRFNAFVERHVVAWELGMALAAIVYVAVGFALDDPRLPIAPLLEMAETGLTTLFILEFAVRFGASRDRQQYLRGHWIDLIALIPATRGIRLLRLVRILRLVRAFAGIYRAVSQIERLARHHGLARLVVAWLGVVLITCAALYAVERDINEAISSPFDALWWGVSTMTTVGYGDVIPVTPEGRIAASVLMLIGIGLFSAITAIVTSYLLAQQTPASRDPLTDLERLAALARDGTITQAEFDTKRLELLARV
jgi:voltage-gated potassium channel